jgi:two-component sensor histidine kinase
MDLLPAVQTTRELRILLLEDSPLDAELVEETLAAAAIRVQVERVVSAADFARALGDRQAWDLILADYRLPGFDGLSALDMVRERSSVTPFVFVSGALGEEVAVEALKRGATDYVLKERLERLPATILRALAEAHEREERQRAQDALHRLLEERTALLHELDHRVKNNLQLLLSLIGLEVRQSKDESVRQVLGRMRERLQALAAAHRDLYDGQGSARFDVTGFARSLCQELTDAVPGVRIITEFDLEQISVEALRAAPMALLFNEIVSNALVHAYQDRHGKLKLSIHVRDGFLLFQLSDEVFSLEEKEAARASASGTVLKALARQLDAVVEWPLDDPATLVRVTMPAQDTSQHG